MTLFAQWYQQFASASQDGSSTMIYWLNYGEKRAYERTRNAKLIPLRVSSKSSPSDSEVLTLTILAPQLHQHQLDPRGSLLKQSVKA